MKTVTRVATNTIFLYIRMLISIVISLYATRLILGALGESDFGVFALVGGVVGMLTFLNSAMAVSTQRYLSYYLGAGQEKKLNLIFKTSVLLHLVIGVIVVVLLEVAGIILFNGFLNIPEDRVAAARLVYHFMVVSTFFTINAVPYDATINSHENMLFIALVGILESVLKLGIAIWLVYTNTDKLILYGALFALMTIIIRIIKGVYCARKYKECSVPWSIRLDRKLLKEMSSFAGWNLFGSLCNVVKEQGLPVILNLFFGVVVNAAYGIANQINWQLVSFSANLIKAINPQIAKSEGGGDRERMLRLAMLASKSSFLLLSFFSIPLILEMSYVLKIWLKDVPEYAIVFSRLVLLVSMVQQLTVGLMRAVQSVGRIKTYQVVVGTILILNLPLAYILVKLGLPAYSVLVGSVVLEVVAGLMRVYFTKKLAGLNVRMFVVDVVMKPVITVVIVYLLLGLISLIMHPGFLRLTVTVLLSTSMLSLMVWMFSLSGYEKGKMVEIVHAAKERFKTMK